MARFKNVSPLGALDIDLLNLRGVEVGEEFDVPDNLAVAFIGQVGTFEAVEVPAEAVAAFLAGVTE